MERILIADDEEAYRILLRTILQAEGFEVVEAIDGKAALTKLVSPGGPSLALIDWEMPGLTGPQVCGQLRAYNILRPLYLILETSRHDATDKVEGFQAGADDYLTKPFNRHEVIARVRVGLRMIQTQASLHQRVRELETALGQVRTLRQLLPICSYCRKIRNDQNYWEQLEVYLGQNSGTRFSHGICPECYNKVIHTQLREAEQFARRKEGPEPSPSI